MRQRQFVLGALVCALALTMVACGGSSNSSTGGSAHLEPALDGSGESWAGAKRGGVLTVYDHEDFQHLDSGQTYFGVDYPVVYATQSPLYMFPPDDATHPIPLLASGAQ